MEKFQFKNYFGSDYECYDEFFNNFSKYANFSEGTQIITEAKVKSNLNIANGEFQKALPNMINSLGNWPTLQERMNLPENFFSGISKAFMNVNYLIKNKDAVLKIIGNFVVSDRDKAMDFINKYCQQYNLSKRLFLIPSYKKENALLIGGLFWGLYKQNIFNYKYIALHFNMTYDSVKNMVLYFINCTEPTKDEIKIFVNSLLKLYESKSNPRDN